MQAHLRHRYHPPPLHCKKNNDSIEEPAQIRTTSLQLHSTFVNIYILLPCSQKQREYYQALLLSQLQLISLSSHLRPFIRLPSSHSPASPDHFTANPSLLHHLPQHGASNSVIVQGQHSAQAGSTSGHAGRTGYGGGAGAGGGYTVSREVWKVRGGKKS